LGVFLGEGSYRFRGLYIYNLDTDERGENGIDFKDDVIDIITVICYNKKVNVSQ